MFIGLGGDTESAKGQFQPPSLMPLIEMQWNWVSVSDFLSQVLNTIQELPPALGTNKWLPLELWNEMQGWS